MLVASDLESGSSLPKKKWEKKRTQKIKRQGLFYFLYQTSGDGGEEEIHLLISPLSFPLQLILHS